MTLQGLRAAACALAFGLLGFVVAPVATAQSLLVLESQPGDPLGGGVSATYAPANGTFSATELLGGVHFDFNGPAKHYYGLFVPPVGDTLAPGEYPLATRPSFRPENRPGLEVYPLPTSGGCTFQSGRFTVYEIVRSGSSIVSFAADFETRCDGAPGALLGKIRFNSAVPLVPAQPVASVLAPTYLETGDTGTLDGTTSRDPAGSALAYAWTQVSGPATSFATPAEPTTTFVAPSVPSGGANVVLRLQVTNGASQSNTRDVTVRIANPADPRTLWYVKSDPGDYLGRGMEAVLLPQPGVTALEGVTGNSDTASLYFLRDNSIYEWSAMFYTPNGEALAVRDYPLAGWFPQGPNQAGLQLRHQDRSCNNLGGGSGRFTIWEHVVSNGVLQKFAADVEQRCGSGPATIRSSIRLRSSIPIKVNQPSASAIAPPVAEVGQLVTLDGSASRNPDGGALTYEWTQVSGPAASITSATAAVATFTAPFVPLGGENLVFEVRATNAANYSATARVTVHVLNAADPRTFIELQSQPGDFIGQGINRIYTQLDGAFTAQSSAGGVAVNFSSLGTNWNSAFLPPAGGELAPGQDYLGAKIPFNRPLTAPGLQFTGSGRSCGSVTGRFTVWEVVVVGGVVQRFAADFEQHCEGMTPALFGRVRFNSTVPLVPTNPIAAIAVVETDFLPGATVLLNGSGSRDPAGGALTYAWRQLSGVPVTLSSTTAATTSFVAPAVLPGGSDLAFELSVSNTAALTATTQKTIHVANPSDRRTFIHLRSEAGDYIGAGETRTYTTQDGPIRADESGTGVVATFDTNVPGQALWWDGIFLPGTGALEIGRYESAQRAFFRAAGVPGLDFSGSGRGCNTLTGRFSVLELAMSNGVVESLAIDFEQHCEGATGALRGNIRVNSTIPRVAVNPIASAKAASDVATGVAVSLDGSRSFDPNDSPLTYGWTQLSGPAVAIASPNAPVASFVAPSVPPGGADLVFELVIANASAASARAQVTVHVASANDERSVLELSGDANDFIGGGASRLYTMADGQFGAGLSGGILTVGFDRSGGSTGLLYRVTTQFAAVTGRELVPGVYLRAERAAFASPLRPGLDISADSRGCNNLTGRFTVYESVVVAGVVQRFAADFEQHCEGLPPAIRGKVRYRSTVPLVPPYPMASAVSVTAADEGNPVTLDGSASHDPGGTALTYSWSQVSGPAATIATPNAAIASFIAPAVPLGGADLVFELLVTNAGGLTSTARTTVHVGDTNDPKTFLYFDSDPGAFLGNGQAMLFTPEDGVFRSGGDATTARVYFDGTVNWSASFAPPQGTPLVAGDYPLAMRSGFGSPVFAGLEFSAFNRGCNTLDGWFHVWESVVVGGVLQRFAADFEQHCDGEAPALRGILRFNSTVPARPPQPIASAIARQYVYAGEVVALDGRASRDPNGTAITYEWTQVSGPAVAINSASSALASFVAPVVGAGGAELVFELRVTNAAAQSSTRRIPVHVWGDAEPKTFLFMDSDPGDYIGAGIYGTYTPQLGSFRMQGDAGSATFWFEGGTFDNWMARFEAPAGKPLGRGVYLAAQRAGNQSPTNPGMDFDGSGRGCNTLTGRFVVWEYEQVGGVVQRFAADLVQHCEGLAPALRASVRFNSTVPRVPPTPMAWATAPASVDPGVTVNLEGSASFDPGNTPLTYSWSQVSGPAVTLTGASTVFASFVAPAVPAGGADLVFALTVTNAAALSSSARVTVHVTSPGDPRTFFQYQSAPGDWVGGGASGIVTPQGAFFSVVSNTPASIAAQVNAGLFDSWTVELVGPSAGALVPGYYGNARRAGFQNPGQPGLSVTRGGNGCNSVSGQFRIYEIVISGGVVQRLAVDFEQSCDGGPLLRGGVRFNSTIAYPGPADTTPNVFAFAAASNVVPGSAVTSNAITVSGIDSAAPISVTGGSYSIGCTGTFTSGAGTIDNGQAVCVRHVAPIALGAFSQTTLTIGGISAMFISTTMGALPANEDWDGDGMTNAVELAMGRNPFVRDNDVMGSARLFAMQQYRDFLGREGDAGGILFYEGLINGGADRGAVIESFFNSPEFSGSVSPIVRLYFATFLRIPDYPGLMYQVGVYRSGAPLEAIANNFTLSPEFTQRYGTLDNRGFVALLYQNILGRTASPGEIDYHAARLQSGASRGAVLAGFSESPEFKQLSATDVYVTMMYAGMLRRVPEQSGFDYWVDYIEDGNSGLALILGFLNSPEYRNRFQ